jgi:hypothetical protein
LNIGLIIFPVPTRRAPADFISLSFIFAIQCFICIVAINMRACYRDPPTTLYTSPRLKFELECRLVLFPGQMVRASPNSISVRFFQAPPGREYARTVK